MTVKYYAILTNQGAARLANATMLGSKLNLTQMAVGDANGVLPTPDPAQTKLINQKRIAPLNLLSVDPNNQSQIIAEQIIPENEGGFWIREIGLYDDEGVLIAVANCPETYKPQLQEGSGRTQTIRMILVVTNTEAITLKIDPSVVLATRKYVDDEVLELKLYVDDQMRNHIAAQDPHTQYAQKHNPTFTGEPKAPTPAAGNNTTRIATTAFVQAAITALINGAPDTLDTLKEIAAAINNDPKFSTTINNALAGKQPLDNTLTHLSGKDVAGLLAYLQLGEAAKRDVGTGNNQLPDMSAFGMSRNGQTAWDILPNGMIRQAGTVTLTPVGNFNAQVLGGVTYYTHYYRVNFPRQFPNAQIATLATLASSEFSKQTTMAGKSLSTHRDTDSGADVSRTRFTVAYTTPNLGETPTLHFEAIGY
ncbi:phage tail protein [Escherichia coli]|nr:phage tail protein [Escherichia coli]